MPAWNDARLINRAGLVGRMTMQGSRVHSTRELTCNGIFRWTHTLVIWFLAGAWLLKLKS